MGSRFSRLLVGVCVGTVAAVVYSVCYPSERFVRGMWYE